MRPFFSGVVLTAAVAALVPAGSAVGAVGHWASPVQVIPPPSSDFATAPQAFVAGGSSIALGADGAKAVLTRGDAAGTFGPLVGLGTPVVGVSSVDGAVGE